MVSYPRLALIVRRELKIGTCRFRSELPPDRNPVAVRRSQHGGGDDYADANGLDRSFRRLRRKPLYTDHPPGAGNRRVCRDHCLHWLKAVPAASAVRDSRSLQVLELHRVDYATTPSPTGTTGYGGGSAPR